MPSKGTYVSNSAIAEGLTIVLKPSHSWLHGGAHWNNCNICAPLPFGWSLWLYA